MTTTCPLKALELLGTDANNVVTRQLNTPTCVVKKRRAASDTKITCDEQKRDKEHKSLDIAYALLFEINKEKSIPLTDLVQRILLLHNSLFLYHRRGGNRAKERRILDNINMLLGKGYVERTNSKPISLVIKKSLSAFIEDHEYIPFTPK